jgi:D-glycero-D-manno-heptose 1,7-bisphosphate phosphatase
MARAVCLDRDGTVIHDANYPRDPRDVRLIPGAAEALAELQRQGYLIVLVSNQSGIGRGYLTPEEADRVHRRVLAELGAACVRVDGAYYCPHAPEDGCECRKPAPGLLLQAARELRFDPARSFMVGDKESDVEAGRRAGCRTIRFGPGTLAAGPAPDFVAADWPAALAWIERNGEAEA